MFIAKNMDGLINALIATGIVSVITDETADETIGETSTRDINLIYARSQTGIIGRADGSLPVRSRSDLAFFKEKTKGAILIVGRKTYEGLPNLPGRTLIVVTKNAISPPSRAAPSVYAFVGSLHDAIRVARSLSREIFVAGGASIYEAFRDEVTLRATVKCVYETVYEGWVDERDGDVTFMWNGVMPREMIPLDDAVVYVYDGDAYM